MVFKTEARCAVNAFRARLLQGRSTKCAHDPADASLYAEMRALAS